MVIINKITEGKSYLYKGEELVGEINSSIELNDCLIQIKNNKLEGYSLLYEGISYPIESNGRMKNGGVVYPIYAQQLRTILGF